MKESAVPAQPRIVSGAGQGPLQETSGVGVDEVLGFTPGVSACRLLRGLSSGFWFRWWLASRSRRRVGR